MRATPVLPGRKREGPCFSALPGGLAQPLLGLPAGAAEPCQQIRFKNVGATAWDRSGEPGMLLSEGQTHQQAIPPLKMIIF